MHSRDLASFVFAVPLPALVISGDETIVVANTACEALIGKATTGRHYMTVLRQPDLVTAVEAVRQGEAARRVRLSFVRSLGDQQFVAHCGPVPEAEAGAVMVWFEDVTHLEEAGRMRRDFVANVSHELRTPLTSLMGFIETLQGPAKDDREAQGRFLEIMAREAARMERLVHDLLSLSRVEVDERRLPDDEVDLSALLRSTVRLLQPQAEAAQLSIALDVPEGGACVRGDEDQLRQVLSNLLENAIKYGAGGGELRAACQILPKARGIKGRAVAVSISDKGQGIDPYHLPKLTERFYRVDTHRSREVGGTGLGLAIVKHIVSRHRGRLKIESELGQGSTFTVILPLHTPD